MNLLQSVLENLQANVNNHLKELSDNIPDTLKNQPVNWADLQVFDIKYCTDDSIILFIDEASPDAHEFKNYIQKYISDTFGIDEEKIYIITEW